MTNEEKPIGQLFTHVYLDRTQKTQDSQQFRKRIGSYCHSISLNPVDFTSGLAKFLKQEIGLDTPLSSRSYYWEKFFEEIEFHYLLNIITLVWRFYNILKHKRQCDDWFNFVQRAIKEENLCYFLDEECGIHKLVDEEFEHNRISALACLQGSKYSGVRDAFEHAFHEFDANPPHTKDAVKSIFESIEILVRQMVETNNLNKRVVQGALKEKALEVYKDDPTAKDAVGKMFEGFGFWVDAIHNYRHGQGVSEPVEPPMDFAVYVLSSGASFLRWLIEIDKALSVNQ